MEYKTSHFERLRLRFFPVQSEFERFYPKRGRNLTFTSAYLDFDNDKRGSLQVPRRTFLFCPSFSTRREIFTWPCAFSPVHHHKSEGFQFFPGEKAYRMQFNMAPFTKRDLVPRPIIPMLPVNVMFFDILLGTAQEALSILLVERKSLIFT